MKILALAVSTALATLTACSAGPSDGEFVQACVSQRGPQLVKVTHAMCECAATFARQNFDPKLRQALVLDMQGRKQDAEALLDGMSFEARGEFAMKQFGMVGQCIGEAAAGR
jgi:hypothetical protein